MGTVRNNKKSSCRLESLEPRRLLAAAHGLSASFYNTIDLTGPAVASRVDSDVNFYWGSESPDPKVNPDKFSARWVGQVEPKYSENYTFFTRSDDGIRVWVDGKLLINNWSRHSTQTDAGSISLQAGKRYDLKVEYFDFSGRAVASLFWYSATQSVENIASSQLYAQGPYNALTATTDAQIEAEDFDLGNRGIAYTDADTGNAANAYRVGDVDIEPAAGGGYDVTRTSLGDSMSYSIDVPATGAYELDLRVASRGNGGILRLSIDDAYCTRFAIPNTGGWQTWRSIGRGGIGLTAGYHIIQLSVDSVGASGSAGNFNYFEFQHVYAPKAVASFDGAEISYAQNTPIDFGTIQSGAASNLTFTVANEGDAALKLGTPSLPVGYTLVEGLSTGLQPGASDTFTVALNATAAGTRSGIIEISTNDSSRNPLAIAITGKVLAPQMIITSGGAVIASPYTLNFGTVEQGSTVPTRTFTVTNTGTGLLTMGTLTLPSGFMLTDGLASTLDPGASDTFTIALDTSRATTRAGSVTLTSNDPARSAFGFALAAIVTSSPTTGAVYLTPGSGFVGATAQPPAIGDASIAGYDAKAIARWDVVPYQTFTNTFNVGVVAFHMNGIDHVSFSVNGGDWTNVSTMTLNPTTNVTEYWATLKASDFQDGQLEVRAIAVPKNAGVARVLQGTADAGNGEVSMFLNANGHGTLANEVRYVSTTGNDANDGLTPQTAKLTTNAAAYSFTNHVADGGTIYLLPGTYTLSGALWNTNSGTSTRWMTVSAAPGVDRSQVVISGTSNAGFNSKLVRFSNVTITGGLQSGGPLVDYGWIDGCAIHGIDWTSGGGGLGGSFSFRYMTSTDIADVAVGPQSYNLIRDVRIDRIGGDAFSGSALVINSSVHEFNQAPGAHTDLWQWVGVASNAIMYGVDDTDGIGLINGTMLFESAAQDVAMVNCNASVGSGYYAVQLGHTLNNVLVENTTFTGGTRIYDTLVATDVVYVGCTFSSPIPPTPGVIVR